MDQANPNVVVCLRFIGRTALAEASVQYNGTVGGLSFPLPGSTTLSINRNAILLSGMLFG